MPDFGKMTHFLPPAGNYSLQAEFECWHPDLAFVVFEKPGLREWTGPEIPPITAGNVEPVDLPTELTNVIKHCWEAAKPSQTATRGPIRLGAAREQTYNRLGPDQQEGLTNRGIPRLVNPTYNPEYDQYGGYKNPKLRHLSGIAADWKVHQQLPRICAYTFRGDKRAPNVIQSSGGFLPPVTRNDRKYLEDCVAPQFINYLKRKLGEDISVATFLKVYDGRVKNPAAKECMLMFSIWRALVDAESLHVGRMVAFEAMKGYISTTKCTSVAKFFAGEGAWVYLLLVAGGFVLPEKGKHTWTPAFGEQEIAMPGKIPWNNVFGFRQVGPNARFVGPIYFRHGFSNNVSFRAAHDLLSGKSQP